MLDPPHHEQIPFLFSFLWAGGLFSSLRIRGLFFFPFSTMEKLSVFTKPISPSHAEVPVFFLSSAKDIFLLKAFTDR